MDYIVNSPQCHHINSRLQPYTFDRGVRAEIFVNSAIGFTLSRHGEPRTARADAMRSDLRSARYDVKPRCQSAIRCRPILKRFAQSIRIYAERLAYRGEREQIPVAILFHPFSGPAGLLPSGAASGIDGAASETIERVREHREHQAPDWHAHVLAALATVKLGRQDYVGDENLIDAVHRSFAGASISKERS
jgi:hypothetical protein